MERPSLRCPTSSHTGPVTTITDNDYCTTSPTCCLSPSDALLPQPWPSSHQNGHHSLNIPKSRSTCTSPCRSLETSIPKSRSACASPNRSPSEDFRPLRPASPDPPPAITLSDSFLNGGSSGNSDPKTRRSRLEHLRFDVAKLNRFFSRSLSGSRSSKESLSIQPPSRSESPDSRQIRVEFQDSDGSRQSLEDWDTPDHNFSSSLVLTSLEQGRFSAEISLAQLPADDLVLYISGHKLEIVVDKSASSSGVDRRHRVSRPYHYGTVDLPIFADTSSLVFAKDSARNVLILQGRTKGLFAARRRSNSLDTLPIPASQAGKDNASKSWRKLLGKLGVMRRAKSHGTIVGELRTKDDHSGVDNDCCE